MSSLTHCGSSQILVPLNRVDHAKAVMEQRNCREIASPCFPLASGGLLGLGQQPMPIACSTELGAGALGRVETHQSLSVPSCDRLAEEEPSPSWSVLAGIDTCSCPCMCI